MNESQGDQVVDTPSLAEQLRRFSHPLEEDLYRSYFDRDIWSLQSFCALMGGLSPDRFKQISESKGEGFAELDIKRALSANKIQKRFLRDFEEIYSMEKPSLVNGDFYMTPWKFIKWVSMNDIPIKQRFFDELPLYLMEIYLEFEPQDFHLTRLCNFDARSSGGLKNSFDYELHPIGELGCNIFSGRHIFALPEN